MVEISLQFCHKKIKKVAKKYKKIQKKEKNNSFVTKHSITRKSQLCMIGNKDAFQLKVRGM
jgi:hypothetical protein